MNQYPPGGVLFYNADKKSDKAPDFSGNVEIDQSMLDELQREINSASDGRAKLDLSGWRKRGKSGKDFVSLKPRTQAQRRTEMGQGGGGGSPSGGGYTPPNAPQNPSQGLADDEIPF